MQILFRSNSLRRDCNVLALAQKRWGSAAAVIRRRLDDLDAAENLRQFLSLPHIKARTTAAVAHVQLTRILEMILASRTRRGEANAFLESRVVVVDGIEETHGR